MDKKWTVYKIRNIEKDLYYIGITSRKDVKHWFTEVCYDTHMSGSPQLSRDFRKNPGHFRCNEVLIDIASRREAKERALVLQNVFIRKKKSYHDNIGGHRKSAYGDLIRYELACTPENKRWFKEYCASLGRPASDVFDSWIDEERERLANNDFLNDDLR